MSKIAVLNSEGSIKNVSKENIIEREKLIAEFRKLPKEVFVRLRELHPEAGCFNKCTFCSQSAGAVTFSMRQDALKNLFSAIKTVSLEIAGFVDALTPEGMLKPNIKLPPLGLVGYGRVEQRPGVIYPYLDNDIGSYPFLADYIRYAYEDLGVRTRLSTVGYSKNNIKVQQTHEEINNSLLPALAGARFSFTPYTYGWNLFANNNLASRDQFIADVSNAVKTYKNAVYYLGAGDRAANIELRFRPLVVNKQFDEQIVDGKHMLHMGPYLLISKKNADLSMSQIKSPKPHKMKIDGQAHKYDVFVSSIYFDNSEWLQNAQSIILNSVKLDPFIQKFEADLYKFENIDGHFYSINPKMSTKGFVAKHFYPKTMHRKVSGYIDAERYFLNTLLEYKAKNGLGPHDKFENAIWTDVQNVLSSLKTKAKTMENISPEVSKHIVEEIFPLVDAYRKVLYDAGYDASFFFDSKFTVDTGMICNLGRAYTEFKGLASRPEMDLTPDHQRIYGKQSSFAAEGKIWRIGPNHSNTPSIVVEAQNLHNRTETSKGIENKYIIPLKGVFRKSFSDASSIDFVVPGQTKLENTSKIIEELDVVNVD